jgi:hypothetical protein
VVVQERGAAARCCCSSSMSTSPREGGIDNTITLSSDGRTTAGTRGAQERRSRGYGGEGPTDNRGGRRRMARGSERDKNEDVDGEDKRGSFCIYV